MITLRFTILFTISLISALTISAQVGAGETGSDAEVFDLLRADAYRETSSMSAIEWATAAEYNNAEWAIERSTDGSNFEVIGRVPGAGSSYTLKEYRFIDPATPVGETYYRLRAIEVNGAQETSDQLTVAARNVSSVDLHVYPNPTIDFVTVIAPGSDYAMISVVNINGQEMMRTTGEGNGRVEFKLDLTEFVAGQYLLVIETETERVVRRIVKKN
jgi:hypothetical protein